MLSLEVAEMLRKFIVNPSIVKISTAIFASEGFATTFACNFRQWSVLSYYCTVSEILQNVSPFHVIPVGKKSFLMGKLLIKPFPKMMQINLKGLLRVI